MCSTNVSVLQCLNGGKCSSNGSCICPSACFMGDFCEFSYNAARLPLTGAIVQDLAVGQKVYMAVFLLFGVFGLVNNILAFITFISEKIRHTVCGIYLILFSIFGIVLMMTILTYIITIVQYKTYPYLQIACYGIPYVSVTMNDGAFLFTTAIAVERILIDCYHFNRTEVRKRGVIVSIFIILYVFGSNIDEIFIRRLTVDIFGNQLCMYDFDRYPTWRRIDIVFSYTHFLIPFTIHLICSTIVLVTIARRKIFIRGVENRFFRTCFEEMRLHGDFFIPPICLIICIVPHGILGHLISICIPYSDKAKLRLHISFVILLFVPQMLCFILYVYPSKPYWREFQKTIVYDKFCCYFYRNQQTLRDKACVCLRMRRGKYALYSVSTDNIVIEQNDNIP